MKLPIGCILVLVTMGLFKTVTAKDLTCNHSFFELETKFNPNAYYLNSPFEDLSADDSIDLFSRFKKALYAKQSTAKIVFALSIRQYLPDVDDDQAVKLEEFMKGLGLLDGGEHLTGDETLKSSCIPEFNKTTMKYIPYFKNEFFDKLNEDETTVYYEHLLKVLESFKSNFLEFQKSGSFNKSKARSDFVMAFIPKIMAEFRRAYPEFKAIVEQIKGSSFLTTSQPNQSFKQMVDDVVLTKPQPLVPKLTTSKPVAGKPVTKPMVIVDDVVSTKIITKPPPPFVPKPTTSKPVAGKPVTKAPMVIPREPLGKATSKPVKVQSSSYSEAWLKIAAFWIPIIFVPILLSNSRHGVPTTTIQASSSIYQAMSTRRPKRGGANSMAIMLLIIVLMILAIIIVGAIYFWYRKKMAGKGAKSKTSKKSRTGRSFTGRSRTWRSRTGTSRTGTSRTGTSRTGTRTSRTSRRYSRTTSRTPTRSSNLSRTRGSSISGSRASMTPTRSSSRTSSTSAASRA